MRSLIVGGASTVGRALIPLLAERGEVVTAGRHDCDVALDISRDFDASLFPEALDVVIHAAAHFGGTTAEAMVAAVETNVVGTMRVCKAAHERGARHLIYVSSVHARFAEKGIRPTAYALTKRQAEEAAQFFCAERTLALSVLRPSQLYGVGATCRRHQPFFYAMLDNAMRNEDVLLYGEHDPLRNYLHVGDLAEALARVADKTLEGTFSCQHPEDVTYSRIARAAMAAFGSTASVRFVKDKPDIPDAVFPIETTLYRTLGWRPQIGIEAGVEQLATHMRAVPCPRSMTE